MKMKYYFGPDAARQLAAQLDLDPEEYASWVAPRVDDLEIKDRVGIFADGLRDRLPSDYLAALDHLIPRLGPELEEGQGYFNHAFYLWPVSRFIEDNGIEHPAESLVAIEALTRAFTGEWAVRPFLERYPELTMAKAHEWSTSDSHNVRRLSTEGIRPRLPWARVHTPFTVDPAPIIPILDRLHADPSTFVRTSVANNLNDISRTHPSLAIETAQRWMQSSPADEGADARTAWTVTRGLRTLAKNGDAEALAICGYGASDIRVTGVAFPSEAAAGEVAVLEATLHNDGAQPAEVLVDYRMHFLKKNGETRPTSFRFGRFTLTPGETRAISKTHRFRVTGTRTYYPGAHAVSLVVNGQPTEEVPFDLYAAT